MSFDSKKLLAGSLLSALISAGATSSAFARPATEIAGRQPANRVETTKMISGTIKSIVGEVVTLNLDNGGTETVRISQQTIKIKGLVSGMRIVATAIGNGAIAEDVKVISPIREVTRETTRVEVKNQREETHQQRVVTPVPTPRRTIETVEIRRTEERRVVTPAPVPPPQPVRRVVTPAPVHPPQPMPQVEPSRPIRGMW